MKRNIKKLCGFRLSAKVASILEEAANNAGMSKTQVVEASIIKYAAQLAALDEQATATLMNRLKARYPAHPPASHAINDAPKNHHKR